MQWRRWRGTFNRQMRQSQRQVEDLGQQAERDIERYVFGRFHRLAAVRRFVISWLLLFILLIGGVTAQNFMLSGYYQHESPVPGGVYNEGVVGTFTTANPLYAVSDADQTVSHLLFASLFTYDDHNNLVGDLAQGYTVDRAGTTYTVTLKPHLTWQDGVPLTSQDVLFTYQLIQNPAAQSSLSSSWQGVTMSTPNAATILFHLPNVLASFPYSLTNGIVPAHILKSIPPVILRSSDFNNVDPVGSGPFKWQGIQVSGTDLSNAKEQIALLPFRNYVGGRPKLDAFNVHVYANPESLSDAFIAGQLNGAEGLDTVPRGVQHMSGVVNHNLLLTAGTYVFFKTSSGVLADQAVRQALVQGANVPGIISNLGYPTRPVQEPLLEGQLGYNRAYNQAGFNESAANKLLDQDGWVMSKSGIRMKAGQPLTFTLSASNTPEYVRVSHELQSDWRRIGVNMQIALLPATDLASTLSFHNYQAVLYGISIGVDPDVFVYWDSSQADVRAADQLNLSEFKDPTSDEALESGRTRLDPVLRAIKYQPFLQDWQQQAPALGLYQPRVLYLTSSHVYGFTNHVLNTAADRLDNVQHWEIREAKVTD